MAISFKDSLHKSGNQNYEEMIPQSPMNMVYAADSDDWVLDEKYLYYQDYYDSDVSTIDKLKNIELSQTQVCLTQESNSQFIPFEMDRFYDNFDLQGTMLTIHFVNAENNEAEDYPVNVYYNSRKIKFCWLVDSRVTQIAGNVQFEIIATGKNEEDEDYIWKTKPCNGLNILRSLSGNGTIEPDDSWESGFLEQVMAQVALAEAAARRAEAAAEEAKQTAVVIDKTLTIEGQAADAKAVGDAIASIHIELDETLTVSGMAADAKAVGDRIDALCNEIGAVLDEINGVIV